MIFTAVSIVPVGIFMFCLRQYFVAPAGGMALAGFVLSTLLAGLLQFFMSYTMALLAFWLLEVSTVIFILFAFEYIAGGHLFPLNILPPGAGDGAQLHAVSLPALFSGQRLSGPGAGAELWRGLAIQAGWTVSFTWWRGGVAARHPQILGRGRMSHGREHCQIIQLRRYAAIYAALWRNSVVREMGFKSNFLLWIVVELLWFGLQFSFIGVIYLHTDHIADWTKWQVVHAGGGEPFHPANFPGLFPDQLRPAFRIDPHRPAGFHAAAADEHPVSGLPAGGGPGRICQRRFRPGGHGLRRPAASSVACGGANPGFFVLCGAGIVIHYSLMFLLASVAFWTVRAQGIVWGYYSLFNIARLPDARLSRLLQGLLPLCHPDAAGGQRAGETVDQAFESPLEMGLLVVMSAACFALSELFWRFSVKRYTSASA